jgi:hypothetical protein
MLNLLSINKLVGAAAMFIESDKLIAGNWHHILRSNRPLTYCGIAAVVPGFLAVFSYLKYGSISKAISEDNFMVEKIIAMSSATLVMITFNVLRYVPEGLRSQEGNFLFKIAGLTAAVELTGILGANIIANKALNLKVLTDTFNDLKSGYYLGFAK